MIKFDKVSIQYTNDFFTLYNFSCEISNNTLFIGDYYSGANSIMRIISKIDKDYLGSCKINNVDIKKIKDKDLDLSYLTTSPILFENKTIFKNLYFPLNLKKINKNIAKNQINALKNELKIDFFEKKINKLNLTEKKIVALMRSVLRQPKIILFENFFENFDEKYYELVKILIGKLPQGCLLIACEKTIPNNEIFKSFQVVSLEK